MKTKLFRNLAALALALVFAAGLLPAALASQTSDFSDIEADGWYAEAMLKMIDAGVIIGDGQGRALTSRPLTRLEAGIMISRTFGLDGLDLDDAITGNFDDLAITDRYVAEYINSVVAAGFMQGDENNNFRPNGLLSRCEALVLMAKAMKVAEPAATQSSFTDFGEVPDWAKPYILALEHAGLIQGSAGKVNPIKATFSRAELATLLSNIIGEFIDDAGAFEGMEINGRAIIRKPGVDVTSLTVSNLLIAQGAGAVTLEDCVIGELTVRSGSGSTNIVNSTVTSLTIDADLTNAHVAADENSYIGCVTILSDGVVFDCDGEVGDIVIIGDDAEVNLPDDGTDPDDPDDPGDPDDPDDPALYTALVGAVHSSVEVTVIAASATSLEITLTGTLAYDDNIFLPTGAEDFEAVLEAGQPNPDVLNGAFTAVEINVKEILAALGFDLVDITQTNPALAAYEQDGGSKIDQPANITESGGVWVKTTTGRDPSAFDDAFGVLILGGETAVLVFTQGDDTFTITIDASGLTVDPAV